MAAKRGPPRAHMSARSCASICPSGWPRRWPTGSGWSGDLGNLSDKRPARRRPAPGRLALRPDGTEGFAKAEVTAGGIATAELSSPHDGGAQACPAFIAIGEAVDVTGWLGGYNFQWAWSSGVAAGLAIAARGA